MGDAPYTHLRASTVELRLHALRELNAAMPPLRWSGHGRWLPERIGRLLIAAGSALSDQGQATTGPLAGPEGAG